MGHPDSRGLPLSTTSDLAAERYRDGVALFPSAWPGAAENLDQASAADPDFALAHAARALLQAIRAEPTSAGARIATAKKLVAQRGTERERSHVEILYLAIDGHASTALRLALAHLEAWPRDVLVFSLPLGAFGLFAFSGRADHDRVRVELCDRHARSFVTDDWWFLTYRGWAHTENGNFTPGRALTQRGYELQSNDANAVHAVSHAMYEGGAGGEAETLIAEWLPSFDRVGILHAFAGENYAECVRFLEPVATKVVRIGGRRAARDVRGHARAVAHARRRGAKPHELLDRWLHRRSSPHDTRRHDLLVARDASSHVLTPT